MELSALLQVSATDRRLRLLEFIAEACCGSQAEASRKLGVTRCTISRVASGEIPVSRKLFHAIASIPNINSDWLVSGVGNPIRNTPKILVDIGSIVPVARKLLPGPLLEHEDLLSNEFIAVPRASYGTGVYAVPVSVLVVGMTATAAAQVLRAHLFKLEDTLLIDTAAATLSAKRQHTLGVVLLSGVPAIRNDVFDDACVGVVTQLFRSF